MIGLNRPYTPYGPRSLPIERSTFIAPYWADADLRGTGEVYYRQTRNPVLLTRATNEIQRAFSMSQDAIVTSLFIVTWEAVGYFNHGTDKVRWTSYVCTYASIIRYIST